MRSIKADLQYTIWLFASAMHVTKFPNRIYTWVWGETWSRNKNIIAYEFPNDTHGVVLHTHQPREVFLTRRNPRLVKDFIFNPLFNLLEKFLRRRDHVRQSHVKLLQSGGKENQYYVNTEQTLLKHIYYIMQEFDSFYIRNSDITYF